MSFNSHWKAAPRKICDLKRKRGHTSLNIEVVGTRNKKHSVIMDSHLRRRVIVQIGGHVRDLSPAGHGGDAKCWRHRKTRGFLVINKV